MNLTRTMTQLGELYEEKVSLPKDTFQVETSKKATSPKGKGKKTFISSPSGPAEAEGVTENKIDPKTSKKNNFFDPKNFSQKNEKTETENINNFMNKSIFDKLYEDVMSERLDDTEVNDAEALGLPGEGEGEGETEGDDSVTLTMDRETAQKLHDLLMDVLGGEEEIDGEEDLTIKDEMNEDEVEDEDGDTLGEATDIKELKGKGESLQNKNNKVGDVTGKLTSKGGGEGKVTDEVSSKSTGKHALVSDTDSGNLKGKNNKVAGKASKVGEYLAGLK